MYFKIRGEIEPLGCTLPGIRYSSRSLCAHSPSPSFGSQALITGCPFLSCDVILLKPSFVIKQKKKAYVKGKYRMCAL